MRRETAVPLHEKSASLRFAFASPTIINSEEEGCSRVTTEFFRIRAGTVHSLSGVAVFEVRENSDVTFRLHDWDRVDPNAGNPRPPHVEQAMACIASKSEALK